MSSAQKNITVEEQIIHEWAFHSVVTNRDLAKDELLSLENVRPARPRAGVYRPNISTSATAASSWAKK